MINPEELIQRKIIETKDRCDKEKTIRKVVDLTSFHQLSS